MHILDKFFPIDRVIELHDVNNLRLHIGDTVSVEGQSDACGAIGVNENNDIVLYTLDVNSGEVLSQYVELTQSAIWKHSIKRVGVYDLLRISSCDYCEIYAVDFDNTLYFDDKEFPLVRGGSWNEGLINLLKLIQSRKAYSRFILWSCRNSTELSHAVDALARKGLFFDAHNDNLPEVKKSFKGDNPRKVFAHHYIDDRNCVIYPHATAISVNKHFTHRGYYSECSLDVYKE